MDHPIISFKKNEIHVVCQSILPVAQERARLQGIHLPEKNQGIEKLGTKRVRIPEVVHHRPPTYS